MAARLLTRGLLSPCTGYFLGVHRSMLREGGSARCQPTTSTYGPLSALSCWNLSYHVEHHDFPGVPWSRLPAVTRAAPEFYSELDSSTRRTPTPLQLFLSLHSLPPRCRPAAASLPLRYTHSALALHAPRLTCHAIGKSSIRDRRSFYSTIWRWFHHGHEWSYGCHTQLTADRLQRG